MPSQWAYFDTSVLVKRYVKEKGSSGAKDLLHRYRFLSSAIAPLEALSAICRRLTTGELAERDYAAIRSKMKKDRAHWELVELSPLVLSQAEELIQRTKLRTLDAIHVASALTFQAASGIQTPFITSDTRQRVSAEEVGLIVMWIE